MPATAARLILEQFEGPWKDESPVFACCRKAVAVAAECIDPHDVATMDVTARVQVLRAAVDDRYPGHISGHRCCANHLADIAFDLPDLLTGAQ